jgi:hypothetical protein
MSQEEVAADSISDTNNHTSHANNHYGTMLIEVPSTHEGRALAVYYNGAQELKWDSNLHVRKLYPSSWCAFHKDCEHIIEPVTSGSRAFLQFDILIEGESVVSGVKFF